MYGLPENLALASVTSTPAAVMGMDHRIGYVKKGVYLASHIHLELKSIVRKTGMLVSFPSFAPHARHKPFTLKPFTLDLVVWDSHPLALGATPKQVFIDGIPQLESPHVVPKPASFQRTPKVPNFDKEAADAVKYEGLPPLAPSKSSPSSVIFTDVKSVFMRAGGAVHEVYTAQDAELGAVIVENGAVTCSGTYASCVTPNLLAHAEIVNAKGGSISPGFTSFGSNLGLGEIGAEPSTMDGYVFDPLVQKVPAILGGDGAVIRAVDGLTFGTRHAL